MLEHWACCQVGSKNLIFFPCIFLFGKLSNECIFYLKKRSDSLDAKNFLQPACSPNSATNMNHPTAHAQAPHSVWAYKGSLCLGLYLYFTLLHNTKALLC